MQHANKRRKLEYTTAHTPIVVESNSNNAATTRVSSTVADSLTSDNFHLPDDILSQHIGQYVCASSSRLVCRQWAKNLPVRRLIVTEKKFLEGTILPKQWNVWIREIVILDYKALSRFVPWYSYFIRVLKRPIALNMRQMHAFDDFPSILSGLLRDKLCCIAELLGPVRNVQSISSASWEPLSLAISENQSLKHIEMRKICETDVPLSLGDNRTIRSASLSSWRPGEWKTLGSLESLTCSLSMLSKEFFQLLKGAKTLRTLVVDNCEESNAELLVEPLCQALIANTSITSLTLYLKTLLDTSWLKISSAISQNNSLVYLHVGAARSGPYTAYPVTGDCHSILLDLLQHKGNLRELHLPCLPIRLPAVDFFEPSLKIEHLTMPYATGCDVSIDLITTLSHLKSLFLVRVDKSRRTQDRDDLLMSLIECTSLESLCIQSDTFSDYVNDLAPFVEISTTLRHLSICGRWNIESPCSKLFNAIKHNTTLQSVEFRGGNRYPGGLSGLQALNLSIALTNHPSISKVVIDVVYKGDKPPVLLAAFASMPRLRSLRMSAAEIDQLKEFLESNETLEFLKIRFLASTEVPLDQIDRYMLDLVNPLTRHPRLKEIDLGETSMVSSAFAAALLRNSGNLEKITINPRESPTDTKALNRAIAECPADLTTDPTVPLFF